MSPTATQPPVSAVEEQGIQDLELATCPPSELETERHERALFDLAAQAMKVGFGNDNPSHGQLEWGERRCSNFTVRLSFVQGGLFSFILRRRFTVTGFALIETGRDMEGRPVLPSLGSEYTEEEKRSCSIQLVPARLHSVATVAAVISSTVRRLTTSQSGAGRSS